MICSYSQKNGSRKIAQESLLQTIAKLIGDIWFLGGPIEMAASAYAFITLIHRTGKKALAEKYNDTKRSFSRSEKYNAGIKELQRRSKESSSTSSK